MKKPQLILAGVVFVLGLIFILHAQETTTPVSAAPDSIVQVTAESQGLNLMSFGDLPEDGTFWLVNTDGVLSPYPCPPRNATNLPIYAITDNGEFLVDGTGGQVVTNGQQSVQDALASLADVVGNLISQVQESAAGRTLTRAFGMQTMDDLSPPGDGGTNDDEGGVGGPSYTPFSTNGLWLQITNVANELAYLNLMNGTDYVYEIYSKTDLTATNWDIAGEVFPTDTNCMPFTVPELDATNLFIWARDWTGITSNGNTTPEWWFWKYFGTVDLSDTNLDSIGTSTLLSDYQNGLDPNFISFSLAVTNNYVNNMSAPVQLNLIGGWPSYVAIAVDDTNYQADANWQTYAGTNLTVYLGSTEGWHDVWIGLRGLPSDAVQTWQYKRLKLDLTPPLLVVTNPATSTVSVPMIQLQGYSPEALGSISYDLTNATGLVTNQQVLVLDQFYSTNTFEFTTNTFQAFDVPLTNGVNTITIHATDLAGNVTTTNLSFTVDYSSRTNPPQVKLYWPQDGTLICNSNYTWRGWVDDPTATVTAQLVDTNGNTNIFSGIVERDGNFWVENLPMSGTNFLTLTATDSAGHVAVTNITVYPGAVGLTITMPDDSQLWNQGITVNGTISDSSDYTVWVNGVKASYTDGTDWMATNVYLPESGTALIQARAIPNSDNSGNGMGGSGGGSVTYDNLGNPDPPSNNDAESQVDKPPRLYVEKYTDTEDLTESTMDHYQDASGNPATSTELGVQWWLNVNSDNVTGNWQDNAGGDSSWTWQTISLNNVGGFTNSGWLDIDYEPSLYPDIVADIADFSDDEDLVSPFQVNMEHCAIGAPLVDTSGSYVIPPNMVYETAYDLQTEKDTGSRHADATMKLVTGGKQGSNRQNLFCFTCPATQHIPIKVPIPIGRWDDNPPLSSATVPPQNMTILKKALGSDGNLWIALPDSDTPIDVTPLVKNVDFYTFDVGAQKYHPYIGLTTSTTNANLDTDTPEVCVGQEVTLAVDWPGGNSPPYVNSVQHWTLPGNYYNAETTPCSTCSTDPFINYSLLANQDIMAWWVSGGTPATYTVSIGMNLQFANGQYVSIAADGKFNMWRPQATVTTVTGTVQISTAWGDFELCYGIPSIPGITNFMTAINSSAFSGDTEWVQVLNHTAGHVQHSDGSWTSGYTKNGVGIDVVYDVLDTGDPYPVSSFNWQWDSPGIPGNPSSDLALTRDFNASTWLMFTPSGGHRVPLKVINWYWSGTATRSGTSWTLTAHDNNADAHAVDTEDYPVWTNNVVNFHN